MEAIGGVLLTTSSTCSRQLSGTLRWPKAISDYAALAKSASRGRTRHHVDQAFCSHSHVASQHLDPRPVDIPSVIGDAEKTLNQPVGLEVRLGYLRRGNQIRSMAAFLKRGPCHIY